MGVSVDIVVNSKSLVIGHGFDLLAETNVEGRIAILQPHSAAGMSVSDDQIEFLKVYKKH